MPNALRLLQGLMTLCISLLGFATPVLGLVPAGDAAAHNADERFVYDVGSDVAFSGTPSPVVAAARILNTESAGWPVARPAGHAEDAVSGCCVAPNSPRIDPADVANRTPQQIDDLVNDAGLISRGPDPQGGRGAYIDSVTGEQRILCHSNACPPHAHVNDPAGNRLDINGNHVPPESPAAHLPLSTDASG